MTVYIFERAPMALALMSLPHNHGQADPSEIIVPRQPRPSGVSVAPFPEWETDYYELFDEPVLLALGVKAILVPPSVFY
jgi:hypothetical protein